MWFADGVRMHHGSSQTSACCCNRDDLADLAVLVPLPQLHASDRDLGASGQVRVDDSLAVVDAVTADGGDLGCRGPGFGQAHDPGAAQVTALAMIFLKVGADFVLRQALFEQLLRRAERHLSDDLVPRTAEIASGPGPARRAWHQQPGGRAACPADPPAGPAWRFLLDLSHPFTNATRQPFMDGNIQQRARLGLAQGNEQAPIAFRNQRRIHGQHVARSLNGIEQEHVSQLECRPGALYKRVLHFIAPDL